MEIKNVKFVFLLATAAVLAGCTHPLAVKNLNMYRNTSLATLPQPIKLGIVSSCPEMEGEKLVKLVADSLPKYNVRTTTAVMNNRSDLDVVATISVNSEYKGSGWNFLINWPGFLIFTPAWHGYNYEVNHDFTILLADAQSGEKINTINIPVSLDIRHAAINRTWTEIGWLEWGVIPFVGGIVFINYDNTVTPLVHDKADPVVADYIAQEIVENLRSVKIKTPQDNKARILQQKDSMQELTTQPESKLQQLKKLKESGLITDEEYENKRNAIIKNL